jgi:hypothetical protein
MCSACFTPAQKISHFLRSAKSSTSRRRRRVRVLDVDGLLERARHELAAARGDAGGVELRERRLRDQRTEIAVGDQLLHRRVVRDLGEERAAAAVQEAVAEAVRRRGESDEPDVRILQPRRLDELPVQRVILGRHQVRLVDQDEIERAELVRPPLRDD